MSYLPPVCKIPGYGVCYSPVDRDAFLLILLATGLIYILSGFVMLLRALITRRYVWIWHTLPLMYVGGTFIYLRWLVVNEVSSTVAVELFVWGQLAWGIWLFVVLIEHMRRWDRLYRSMPNIKGELNGN